jgi:hypothetical protein
MSDHDRSGHDQSGHDHDEAPAPGPPRGALLALLLVAVLVGAFMFVMHRLNQAGRLQDCVASGRTNCAPIDTQRR